MHEQDLAIVKALVSVAWADGRVAPEEMQVIEALLSAYDATPSEAAEVRAYAAMQRTLDDIAITDLSYDDRRVLLQHSVLITFVDGSQGERERLLLNELCERLRIPELEAQGIIAAAEARAKEMLPKLS